MMMNSGSRDLLMSPLANQLDAVYCAMASMMKLQGVERAVDLVATTEKIPVEPAISRTRRMRRVSNVDAVRSCNFVY
ncbi:hypothetical protein QMK17_15950 [Rhodococcus sp. G-MC3]|uniref:hypothetical protein n=1 Tax=Rhodococcus sp. G-MC3 TaxID=3046209 RepID=UPI0024BA45E7|nr:hypothetical protein [Rhodococcus sp. G-MC3]MDJ0394817.1 hypothetical protein [Rhodococcus sp. G-MC3]